MNQLSIIHPVVTPAVPESATEVQWGALLNKKIVEISAPHPQGVMSYATHLVLQAQRCGETTAWVQPANGPLYPPDLHESGIDLAALAVIQVPCEAGRWGGPKAAEILLRSGAFGLVVLDLTAGVPAAGATAAWQGRLLGLAREHGSSVIILTQKPTHDPSLGAWVSWRIEPSRQPLGDRMFLLAPAVLKNKGGHTWPSLALQRRGPWGIW